MKYLTLILCFLLAGCITTKPDPDYSYVEVNIQASVLDAPSCDPGSLKGGYRAGCLKDLKEYDEYLGRYLLTAYEEYDLPGLKKKLTCDHGPFTMPRLKTRPTIADNASNKSDEELTMIVTRYTKELQRYNSYVISTFNDAINSYNRKCNDSIL